MENTLSSDGQIAVKESNVHSTQSQLDKQENLVKNK
jgi:hypothetical protein